MENFIEGIIGNAVGFFSPIAIEFGVGDYNQNGRVDVLVRLVRKGNNPPFQVGPFDIPEADIPGLFASLTKLLPTAKPR